jgi:hypothetical protein
MVVIVDDKIQVWVNRDQKYVTPIVPFKFWQDDFYEDYIEYLPSYGTINVFELKIIQEKDQKKNIFDWDPELWKIKNKLTQKWKEHQLYQREIAYQKNVKKKKKT